MALIKKVGEHDPRKLIDEIATVNRFYLQRDDISVWDLKTQRQENIRFHQHTQYIPLRKQIFEADVHQIDRMGTEDTEWFERFPRTRKYINIIEDRFDLELAMASYVKLFSSAQVYPHIDGGKFYESHERYHLVLQGKYDFHVEDEVLTCEESGLYWFDNTKTHWVQNLLEIDRISLIMDFKKL